MGKGCSIDVRGELCRSPCIVHDRLGLGDTIPLGSLWGILLVRYLQRAFRMVLYALTDAVFRRSHSVWQYALHATYFGPKGWSLQDDAARDEHCAIGRGRSRLVE